LKKIIGLLLMVMFFITACSSPSSSNSSNELKEIEKQLRDLGVDASIPYFESYPVRSVILFFPPKGFNSDHYTVHVGYTAEKGELSDKGKSKEYIENFEKKNEAKILYGPYEGRNVLQVQISNKFSDLAVGNNTKVIDGKKIFYDVSEHTIFAGIDTNTQGSYMLTFHLNDNFSEDDALDMISSFLEQIQ
jgi:hypothetical protein